MKTLACTVSLLALAAGAASAQSAETDPRVGLSAGTFDAGEAISNLHHVATLPPPEGFFDPEALFAIPTAEERAAFRAAVAAAEAAGEEPPSWPQSAYTPLALASTDFAFTADRVYMGNYHGFLVYDIDEEAGAELVSAVVCPGGQNDVSVYGDLLFMSVEANRARLDCGGGGIDEDVSEERFRGIRIFDISDVTAPRQVAAVQTCRGSHTHTILPDPNDPNKLYIYNSGTAGVRSAEELEICSQGQPEDNPETALYSIDVIEVALDAPETASIINRPRIFADRDTGEIAGLWRGGAMGVATQRTAQTNHCHDITVFPELNLAAGACSGNGILLDISDPANPARIDEIFDPDMAYWHSATFNNDGTSIVFTDEWSGGVGPRCQATDPENWGANLIADLSENSLDGRTFYKLPAPQGPTENCVAHNGSLIPVPGRDIMVQAWYAGGLSLMDFTDPDNPFEIAYFDRGPIDEDQLYVHGYWSTYWHNGRIYGSEIARGLDVFRLLPSEHLSPAEIAAAEAVMVDLFNPQTQERIVWDDTPNVARSYLDQLVRGEAIDSELANQARVEISRWEEGRISGRRIGRLVSALTDAAGGMDEGSAHANRLTALAGVLERAAG